MRLFSILCLIFLSAAVPAGEVEFAHAENEGNEYRLNLGMRIQAGKDDVFALLTDHDGLRNISDILTESISLQRINDNTIRRRLVAETCVLFFCFKAVMVEDAQEFPEGRILAVMVPEQSDFHYGRTEWSVNAIDEQQSQILYRCELQPSFWIPPVIGPFVLKRKMINEARDSILKIESLANSL